MWRRALKLVVGILLLPLCWSTTQTLWQILTSLQHTDSNHTPVSFIGLAAGFVFWIILYFSMSRPTRTYVLGHELTHALWAWLLGGRVSKLRVGKQGGSVQVSNSNFIVTLAPYFFPFYTVCVLLLYGIVSIFTDQHTYVPFWMGCVGLSWAFHLTFTVSMLRQHQPDILSQGRLFSYTLIYILNLAGLLIWLVGVGSPTLERTAQHYSDNTRQAYHYCGDSAKRLVSNVLPQNTTTSTDLL
jgi:hypothetical protein